MKFYANTKKSDRLRVEKLTSYIRALVRKGESSLEAIRVGLPAQTDQASRVKQVKRFLQSKYTDCHLLFFPFIRALLAGLAKKRAALVLVIDGTDLGKSCGALMLSVILGKRALPLVWLVKQGNKGHFSVSDHWCLLKQDSNRFYMLDSSFTRINCIKDTVITTYTTGIPKDKFENVHSLADINSLLPKYEKLYAQVFVDGEK
ncbi:MAG: hypothetical protein OHK0057_32190 [Thermoflexibacter sp.]